MKQFSQYLPAAIIHCEMILLFTRVFAQGVLFDFNNAPLHSSLPIIQSVNGITAQFSSTGQGFSIQEANTMGFTPQGFSGNVIYPNSIYKADLLIKFNLLITDFSIMYSCQELGCDDAATMRVTAFRYGTLAGTNTKTASNPGTWPVDTLSCRFSQGFDSVVVHYDSRPPTCQDYGVIFMADNMRVTAFAALPVNLLYFNGETNGNTALLQWKVTEESLLNYIVQYSADGIRFKDIAIIAAEGANHSYHYNHSDVYGTAFYRLKMNEPGGSYNYSDIIKLIVKPQKGLTVHPNPADDFIYLNSEDPNLKLVEILSVEGVLLKRIGNYSAGQGISIGEFAKGMYIVRALPIGTNVWLQSRFVK